MWRLNYTVLGLIVRIWIMKALTSCIISKSPLSWLEYQWGSIAQENGVVIQCFLPLSFCSIKSLTVTDERTIRNVWPQHNFHQGIDVENMSSLITLIGSVVRQEYNEGWVLIFLPGSAFRHIEPFCQYTCRSLLPERWWMSRKWGLATPAVG